MIIFALPFEKYQMTALAKPIFNLKQHFFKQFKSQNFSNLYQLGILNGLLPCGTVYLALAASMVVANPAISGLFMMVFGLGTIPLLAFISLSLKFIPSTLKNHFAKLSPLVAILFGLFFILKGSNLNIPHINPVVSHKPSTTNLICK
jgi:uncharacterized protein